MKSKKSVKTQKKKITKPKSGKKTVTRTIKKVVTGKTTAKKPGRTATAKRVPAKKPVVRSVKAEKVAIPKSAVAKKLSGREKLIQGIKKNLIMQRNELLNEAEEALNLLPGQTIFPDMGDQASAEIDRSFMLRLRGREQRLLKKIEAAIDKIDTGAFGTCEVCGEEIDLKRLMARPVTTMCIFCKTEQEEEEKLRGR